jgi:hypothetical protein
MFGLGKDEKPVEVRVSSRLCTDKFNGKYPHVGLYDCRARKVWVAKPLAGQAIRTSHARLITGSDNATSTAWKDRFLCFWFYTPNTGEGYIHGYPIDWEEAHLLVRIDPHLERQFKHGEKIVEFFRLSRLKYPFSLHFIGQRAADSLFYVKRIEPGS